MKQSYLQLERAIEQLEEITPELFVEFFKLTVTKFMDPSADPNDRRHLLMIIIRYSYTWLPDTVSDELFPELLTLLEQETGHE